MCKKERCGGGGAVGLGCGFGMVASKNLQMRPAGSLGNVRFLQTLRYVNGALGFRSTATQSLKRKKKSIL